MKKISVLVLMISLAMSTNAVQAKDNNKNDQADFFSPKKYHLVCDRNNCWKSHDKVKVDHIGNNKDRKHKHENKFKKNKKHKHNGKPTPVEAVPEINAGGAAMALLLAAALILTVRERRNNLRFDHF